MQLPVARVQRNNDKEIYVEQLDLTEDAKFMDQYKKILGDAQARVSVSADMALKEFGSGAGAMVTVTLACNQDKDSIETAIDLAGSMARDYCVEQQKLAEHELMKSRQLPAGKNPY